MVVGEGGKFSLVPPVTWGANYNHFDRNYFLKEIIFFIFLFLDKFMKKIRVC